MNDDLLYLYCQTPTRTYLIESGNSWQELRQKADQLQGQSKWDGVDYRRHYIVNRNNVRVYTAMPI